VVAVLFPLIFLKIGDANPFQLTDKPGEVVLHHDHISELAHRLVEEQSSQLLNRTGVVALDFSHGIDQSKHRFLSKAIVHFHRSGSEMALNRLE
jgi:hypothetical protein